MSLFDNMIVVLNKCSISGSWRRSSLIFLLFLFFRTVLYSQGLLFKGNDCVIDERTSYEVFSEKKPKFKQFLALDFKIFFNKPSYGYILRIKSANRLYNLLYDGNDPTYHLLTLNEEGKNNLLSIKWDKREKKYEWNDLFLKFDLVHDSIVMRMNERAVTVGNVNLEDEIVPNICFGKYTYMIDVPSVSIKDLNIQGYNKSYFFPLNESFGKEVHDINKKKTGKVSNPHWLINDAYNWRLENKIHFDNVAGIAFNQNENEIYCFTADSFCIYNIEEKKYATFAYANKCPLALNLASCFLDSLHNRLYVYEVYDEQNYGTSNKSVTFLDLETLVWNYLPVFPIWLDQQLHHHAGYFDEERNRYVIFGGYGNQKYSNHFYELDLSTQTWSLINSGSKDRISPRYFSAIGLSDNKKDIYLFGGMGNELGLQSIGRLYYYDLFRIDKETSSVSKKWEISWSKEKMVPARNLVIEGDSVFYALCYPEHFTKSYLQLYQFSIKDGSHILLGDSIPIYSDKIKSKVHLYMSKVSMKMYAIVQSYKNEEQSDIALYSISCPLVSQDMLNQFESKHSNRSLFFYVGLFFFVIVVIVLLRQSVYRRKKANRVFVGSRDRLRESELTSISNADSPEMDKQKPNSVYLFGEFKIYSPKNKDISYLFSPKLKQILILILYYTDKGGISSQLMSMLLWPEKNEKQVKNIRNVTLNHLRKALNELNGINLVYENGLFRFIFTNDFYCDYILLRQLLNKGIAESVRVKKELLMILSKGKFLQNLDDESYDCLKAEVENLIEPVLRVDLKYFFDVEDYTKAFLCATLLFNIDPVDEEALFYALKSLIRLNMKEKAQNLYIKYITEYKKTTGNLYSTEFNEIIMER